MMSGTYVLKIQLASLACSAVSCQAFWTWERRLSVFFSVPFLTSWPVEVR
jgi:hypothetical protein